MDEKQRPKFITKQTLESDQLVQSKAQLQKGNTYQEIYQNKMKQERIYKYKTLEIIDQKKIQNAPNLNIKMIQSLLEEAKTPHKVHQMRKNLEAKSLLMKLKNITLRHKHLNVFRPSIKKKTHAKLNKINLKKQTQ